MINETYKDIKKNSFKNVQLINMNINNLTFQDNYFDNILCGFSIEVNESNLNEILRVLKKGGKISVSTWGTQTDQKWLTEIVAKYLCINDNNNTDKKMINYNELLQSANFNNIKITECTEDVIYENEDAWWNEMNFNAFRGIIDEIYALGLEHFNSFKESIYSGLQSFKIKDGFKITMSVIYIVAEK